MSPLSPANRYQHFDVALYATVYDVRQMADLEWLQTSFETISARCKAQPGEVIRSLW